MSSTPFPALGHVYEANFGSWIFHLHFQSEAVMTLTNVEGPLKGTSETVQIAVTPIRPGVFMICWQEADKTTVIHIDAIFSSAVMSRVYQKRVNLNTIMEIACIPLPPKGGGPCTLCFR